MIRPKIKPWRSKEYRDWVTSNNYCVNCFSVADDAHHITGLGGVMGGKNSDITCIPMCRRCHSLLHCGNLNVDQYYELARIIQRAADSGVLNFNKEGVM